MSDEQEPVVVIRPDETPAEALKMADGYDFPIDFTYGDYAYCTCVFFDSALTDVTRNADGSWTGVRRPDRHVTEDGR